MAVETVWGSAGHDARARWLQGWSQGSFNTAKARCSLVVREQILNVTCSCQATLNGAVDESTPTRRVIRAGQVYPAIGLLESLEALREVPGIVHPPGLTRVLVLNPVVAGGVQDFQPRNEVVEHRLRRSDVVGGNLEGAGAEANEDRGVVVEVLSNVIAEVRHFPERQAFQFEMVLASRGMPALRPAAERLYSAYINRMQGALSAAGYEADEAVTRLVFASLDGLVFQRLTVATEEQMRLALHQMERLLPLAPRP